jgi:dephospho-CoA kinase
MPVFGITGGIACGKSTFRDLLVRRTQAESFDADACVSELLEGDQSVREQIPERFIPALTIAREDRTEHCFES